MKALAITVASAISLGLAATPALASEGCDPGEIVIKFSHVTAAKGHPKGEAAALLAQRVNKEMDGKVCMQVYPNKQLYNDKKVLEAMLLGDVQMAAPSLSKFEKYTKKYRIFDLPFMFKDIEAVDRFQNSATGEKLKNAMRRKGLQGLAFWHNGMKQMSANRPLIHPSDAKGLKFRIQSSDVLKAQFEQLGAIPQKMAFSEVYGALQSGVVDGQENTWSNIYTKKFFEVQDGVTETNHGVLDYLVVTSTEFWNGLPDDVRNQLKQILDEVTAERNKVSTQINEQNKQKIIAAGSPVRTLTPAQRQEWVNALKPVWKKFEGDVGADVIAAAQKANEG
ncbi:MAG: DctP family TRAP transporter solute-binding subunit [Gammaproteobacteria bacterium]|nr:MAG: DctP family TRAP transporter solute-binding subunit [Gammaproteobacteria bacterium]